MDKASNYIDINKASWNRRTGIHMESEFYDMPAFMSGKSSLKEIELPLLGDIKGKDVLHLQCHFGQDSLSLARMGARVTGVDFSDKAIESARQLSEQLSLDANFICCDIYELEKHLDKKFDIVFTSYGTIGWLPDLDKWAKIISSVLKHGGAFVFAEFHPVVWMFDNDFTKVAYHYAKSGPIIETESGTYADREAPIIQEYVCWNHGIGEVLNSLILRGLEIRSFCEYDYSPYNVFRDTVEAEPGKFRIEHLGDKIPMVYSLLAKKI